MIEKKEKRKEKKTQDFLVEVLDQEALEEEMNVDLVEEAAEEDFLEVVVYIVAEEVMDIDQEEVLKVARDQEEDTVLMRAMLTEKNQEKDLKENRV